MIKRQQVMTSHPVLLLLIFPVVVMVVHGEVYFKEPALKTHSEPMCHEAETFMNFNNTKRPITFPQINTWPMLPRHQWTTQVAEFMTPLHEIIEVYDEKIEEYEGDCQHKEQSYEAERVAAAAFKLNYLREFRKFWRNFDKYGNSLYLGYIIKYATDLASGMQRCFQIFYTKVEESEVYTRCNERGMMVPIISSEAVNTQLANGFKIEKFRDEVWIDTKRKGKHIRFNYRSAKMSWQPETNPANKLDTATNGIYVVYSPSTNTMNWDTSDSLTTQRAYMCMYYKYGYRRAKIEELTERPLHVYQ